MSIFYKSFRGNVLSGELETVAIGVLLVGSKFEPDASLTNRKDITGEVTGQGYQPGGLPLVNQRIENGVFTGDHVSWKKATIRATGAVLYKQAGGQLICYVDFGEERASTNGDFRVKWDAEGILNLLA